MMPTSSMGDSFLIASLAISFSQRLPSAISQACMISARPPLPCTLNDLMSQSTGRAFSTGLRCQPPAPKPLAQSHDMGAGAVILHAVAGQTRRQSAPLVLHSLRLKDRLISIRLLPARQGLLKAE